jgi:hypothetical protein
VECNVHGYIENSAELVIDGWCQDLQRLQLVESLSIPTVQCSLGYVVLIALNNLTAVIILRDWIG